MSRHVVAASVTGTFGSVFVIANASAPWGPAVADAFRVSAILALVALVAMIGRAGQRDLWRDADGWDAAVSSPGSSTVTDRNRFRRVYWSIVAAEVALLLLGRAALGAWHVPAAANVALIALVVGLHLEAFAAFGVWATGVRVPGRVLTALGLLGLALAWTPAAPWVPALSGVVSGFTLLFATLTWVARDLSRGRLGLTSARSRR